MNEKILDIGCGKMKHRGAIGIDKFPAEGVDIVHDLNIEPWPIEANSIDKFYCTHVIEHIRELQVLAREIVRIAKDKAIIEFVTPHFSSYTSYGDPTHLWHFSKGSIAILFEQNIETAKFQVYHNEIRFSGSGLDFFGWLLYKISKKKYEKHFTWIFPANEVETFIRIKKP